MHRAVCYVAYVGIELQTGVLVAALDLSLVRLLRGAIRTADIAGGKFSPPDARVAAQQSRQIQNPERCIDARDVIRPADRYEPREVIHPAARFDNADCITTCPDPGAYRPCDPCLPQLLPPWRIPLDKIPLPARPIVKVHLHRVDVHNKGSLIDVFL